MSKQPVTLLELSEDVFGGDLAHPSQLPRMAARLSHEISLTEVREWIEASPLSELNYTRLRWILVVLRRSKLVGPPLVDLEESDHRETEAMSKEDSNRNKFQMIDWNELSRRGLLERINREILHPIGLAACRSPKSGISPGALIAPDGQWSFADSPSAPAARRLTWRERITGRQQP
jgi:hypothetical protein